MEHVPLDQHATDGPRTILHHAVGTALGHLGGLQLFNPVTKRVFTCWAYKVLGPEPQPYTRLEYKIDADGSDYQYSISTKHLYKDNLELYKTLSVVKDKFDEDEGPVIVAYRRHVTDNGKMLPKTEGDVYAYHIQDIVHDTVEYARDHPDKSSKKSAKKVADQLRAYGVTINPTTNGRLAFKSATNWNRRPRHIVDVLSLPNSNPERTGSLTSTAAEIKSLRYMGTWDHDEVLEEEQMRTFKVGMSRIVFAKKYHPDVTFDKYKSRIIFRGDRWSDLYNNMTYAVQSRRCWPYCLLPRLRTRS